MRRTPGRALIARSGHSEPGSGHTNETFPSSRPNTQPPPEWGKRKDTFSDTKCATIGHERGHMALREGQLGTRLVAGQLDAGTTTQSVVSTLNFVARPLSRSGERSSTRAVAQGCSIGASKLRQRGAWAFIVRRSVET